MNKAKKSTHVSAEKDPDGVQTGSLIPKIADIKKKLTAFFKNRPKREDLEDKGILLKGERFVFFFFLL